MTNDKNDRDAAVERLLAGTMAQAPVGVPGDACLDADTLAAWADDALEADERTAAEAHAAGCSHCQALLAAMARTAPPAPEAAAAWWRMPSLRWLVPLTAATAALVVWTVVPLRDLGRPAVREVSQSAESIAPPAAEPNDAPVRATPPAAPPVSRADADAQRDDHAQAKAKELDAAGKVAAAPSANAMADAASADVRLEKAQPAPPPQPSRLAEAVTIAPSAPPAAAAPRRERAFSPGAPENLIVSSNPASRWRIVPGGAVQRSADGGSTWQTQSTGVTDTLSAGSSPSPSVCWLVGPDGIVLLTTDGTTWKRLAFPEKVLLTAIRAADAQTATVTAEDGREFITEDAGRTWRRGQ